jgi:ketosteroid isomerase-like protein
MDSTAFAQHRIDAFNRGDVDALVNDYTPNSMIITPMGNMTGPEMARQMIAGFVQEFGDRKLEIIKINSAGNVAHFSWKAETPKTMFSFGNETYFLDSGGKIIAHVFDGVMSPK